MLAARDIDGWQRSMGIDGQEDDFYVRQLWDCASIDLSTISESGLLVYTRACGRSLARRQEPGDGRSQPDLLLRSCRYPDL